MNIILKKFFLLLFLCIFTSNAFAVSETQIKAVFLEKFTHLIQWPKEDNEDFVVCVLKDKAFAKALKEIYKSKSFNKRTVRVISIDKENHIPACQLLFIGKDTSNIDNVLHLLKKRSILTVSDNKDNVSQDVMITMFLTKKRFKYIINNKAAQEVDVKISHLLLRSAQEVIK